MTPCRRTTILLRDNSQLLDISPNVSQEENLHESHHGRDDNHRRCARKAGKDCQHPPDNGGADEKCHADHRYRN